MSGSNDSQGMTQQPEFMDIPAGDYGGTIKLPNPKYTGTPSTNMVQTPGTGWMSNAPTPVPEFMDIPAGDYGGTIKLPNPNFTGTPSPDMVQTPGMGWMSNIPTPEPEFMDIPAGDYGGTIKLPNPKYTGTPTPGYVETPGMGWINTSPASVQSPMQTSTPTSTSGWDLNPTFISGLLNSVNSPSANSGQTTNSNLQGLLSGTSSAYPTGTEFGVKSNIYAQGRQNISDALKRTPVQPWATNLTGY